MEASQRAELVRAAAPAARRHARALTGCAGRADALVGGAVRAGLPRSVAPGLALHAAVSRAAPGAGTTPQRRRQLLLPTMLEDLSVPDAAEAVGLSLADARRELAAAHDSLRSITAVHALLTWTGIAPDHDLARSNGP